MTISVKGNPIFERINGKYINIMNQYNEVINDPE